MVSFSAGNTTYADANRSTRRSRGIRHDNGMEENPRSRVIEASATFKFDTSEECDKTMEELCAHFREIMKEEPQFDENTRLGPVHEWDPPDQLQICTIASAQRIVRIIQYPNHFFLLVEREK